MSATLPLDRSSDRQAQRSSPDPRRLRRSVAPYLFITPFLVVFAAFVMVPLCYAFYLSLFQDKLIGGRHFSGIANYVDVFGDNAFWEGVWHMLLFGIVQVPVMLALSLAMALILDHGVVWLRGAFRIAFFIPYAVPSVVATLIWGYLYGKSFGPFSQAAHALGLPTIDFLSSRWMLPSLANVVTWEFVGYNMVILYSALQAVPADLAEAAAMDGASPLQTALLVKVPSIRGALLLTAIFSIIGTLQLFNEPQLLKAAAPSVIGDHYTPNVYAYALAFTDQQYNYSAAVSFVLGALIAVISYGFMLSTRDKGEPG
jgi:multiple sugar transport system permease protein